MFMLWAPAVGGAHHYSPPPLARRFFIPHFRFRVSEKVETTRPTSPEMARNFHFDVFRNAGGIRREF